MTKLHYVAFGDMVNFTYITAVLVEAKLRGCNVLQELHVTYTKEGKNHSGDKVSDAGSLNSIIRWLLQHYPDKYELE